MQKSLIILALFIFIPYKNEAQHILYFKDFDLFKMTGVDTIFDTKALPDFYVECVYDNTGKITNIRHAAKYGHEYYHDKRDIRVLKTDGRRYVLFYGAGKTRTGYRRSLFQQKIYETDSAYTGGDTLYFKYTTNSSTIRVQVFINKGGDSILAREFQFLFKHKKVAQKSVLSSLSHANKWAALYDSADMVLEGAIRLQSDPIFTWQVVKTYRTRPLINVTKKRVSEYESMPVSFFWLKHMGFL